MTTHYQIGLGKHHGSLCGSEGGRFKCIVACDHCDSYVVNCPSCLYLAEELRTGLNERHEQATPRFQHDCDSCVFLGTYDSGEMWGGSCDLYFCPRCDDGSVIARYSDDGPDYRSGMIPLYAPDRRTATHLDGTPADMTGYPLHEAYDRVVARGLWEPKKNS